MVDIYYSKKSVTKRIINIYQRKIDKEIDSTKEGSTQQGVQLEFSPAQFSVESARKRLKGVEKKRGIYSFSFMSSLMKFS